MFLLRSVFFSCCLLNFRCCCLDARFNEGINSARKVLNENEANLNFKDLQKMLGISAALQELKLFLNILKELSLE